MALALMLASCGGGGNSPVTSVIDLESPGVNVDGTTRANVHCGWGAIWVPLEWTGVPEGTRELAIYIGRFKHVEDGGTRKLAVPYAVLYSQIEPSLRKLAANTEPEGSGWSRIGQVSCPPVAKGQRVLVEVFALDRVQARREMKRRLATRLTEEALADPRPSDGPRSPGKLTADADAIGRLILDYPGPH
ncbi:MAG: hypothetical protein ACM3N0_02870 [Chloroflexota bacterium]